MSFLLEGQTLRHHLLSLVHRAKTSFTQSLLPGVEGVLGLRVPDVRNLAHRIVKAGRWEEYFASAELELMEERMLYGLVLSLIPVSDVDDYLARLDCFVPIINSWSVCDVFKLAGKPSLWKAQRERLWCYLQPKMQAEEEYVVRFGVVVAKQHFIDEEYILRLLEAYAAVRHEGYYARMAVAWGVSECLIRQPDPTLDLLRSERLPRWTHNKAIQKACESLRPSAEMKLYFRSLKRKGEN